MSVNPENLRTAMRQWATGVTVVSVALNGDRHGMTVSSFTSLSLDPPLVMVSLENVTRTRNLVMQAGRFGVTILRQEQQDISDVFAGRHTEHLDRFEGLPTYTLVSGCPLLAGGLAGIDCRVVTSYPAGNHTVFIADVLAVNFETSGSPLLYYDRDYRVLKL